MIFRYLAIIGLVLFTSGFGFLNFGKSLENDISEQQDTLDGIFVAYWKGGKISLRSLPINEETKVFDFDAINKQQAEKLGLGPHLKKLFDTELLFSDEPSTAAESSASAESSPAKELSITQIYEFSKELYQMKDTTEGMDEDDYPTFLEIIAHGKRITTGKVLQYPKPWTNSLDHWMFALTMEARTIFSSWKTYELSKVDIAELETTDYKSMASLHIGIDNLRNEWFYLAEQSFTNSIVELNKAGFSLDPSTKSILNDHLIDGFTAEQQIKLLLRATSYLMRGWARQNSEEDELMVNAAADVELALEDFNLLGIDNELVWLAESYLYIKKGDIGRAVISLDKISASELITDNEKELIVETKTHLQNREPDKALNFLTDKVFMYKLGISYAYSYAEEIEWVELLQKSDEGKEILDNFKSLESAIEKIKDYLSLEEIKKKGESLLE